MEKGKVVIWVFRTASLLIILGCLAFFYTASGSLEKFLMPNIRITQEQFIPDLEFQITSIDHERIGENQFLIKVGIYNTGGVEIGLKNLDVSVNVQSFNLAGRLRLQSSKTVPAGGSDEVSFIFILENGDPDILPEFLSRKPSLELSGSVIAALNGFNIPLNISMYLSRW
ncbi:MAG: hypothetical protein ACUVQ0_01990 [Thermoproteota archaeon]